MKNVLVLNSETMGRGADELGRQLIGGFLRKLWNQPSRPEAIVFYNSAVKLLVEGAPALDALEGLSRAGVDLVACGTCCDYFEARDRIRLGRISDMQEITSLLMNSTKVTTI
jgi:selenium metabolism protein YedF